MRIVQSAANRRKPPASTSVKCFCLIFTILSALLLTACGDEDVLFTRTDDGTDPGKLEFLVENHTGWKIQFVDYGLQQKREGNWMQMVSPRFNFSDVTAHGIKRGQSAVIKINARYLFGELEPGEYMVRGEYRCYHPFRLTEFYPMNCVFTISAEESVEIAAKAAAEASETAQAVPAE